MMFMPKTPYRIPLTAAALAILLAACGGGSSGGSNRVVSSSPAVSGPTDSSGTITAGGSATINVNSNATAIADSSSASGANASTTPPANNAGNPSAPGTGGTPQAPSTPPTDTGANNGNGNTATPNTPSAPTTTPSQVQPTQPTAPIAAAGVRGDALLTMFDQKVCISPQQATAHNGSAVPPGDANLPPLQLDVSLSPSNYLPVPGAPSTQSQYGALNDVSCDPKLYPYAAAKAGEYTIQAITNPTAMFLYTHSFGKAFEGRPFTGAIAKVPLNIGNGQATIGTTAKIETMVVNNAVTPGADTDLSTANNFSFGPTDQVSYGVLQQWTSGTDFTKLMLLPGSTAEEARLCWNIDTQQVKRLHCTVWRATADWKRGQTLEVVDQYLVDDRSVHANESGFLYWRTKFPG